MGCEGYVSCWSPFPWGIPIFSWGTCSCLSSPAGPYPINLVSWIWVFQWFHRKKKSHFFWTIDLSKNETHSSIWGVQKMCRPNFEIRISKSLHRNVCWLLPVSFPFSSWEIKESKSWEGNTDQEQTIQEQGRQLGNMDFYWCRRAMDAETMLEEIDRSTKNTRSFENIQVTSWYYHSAGPALDTVNGPVLHILRRWHANYLLTYDY